MKKYEKIAPNQTTVDPTYQRDYDEKRAEAMSRSFDENLVGVPVLARREDGSIVRIDCQHRFGAAIMAGLGAQQFHCEVHTGLSLKDEANLFLRLNNGRSAVRTFDKFKARIVAQEPKALQIVAQLRSVSSKLKIVKSVQKHGVIAVQAVEAAFHRGNLVATMRVLTEWADGEPSAYEGSLIRAVAAFLGHYGDERGPDLVPRLRGIAPATVQSRLKFAQKSFECSPNDAACIVVRDIYNMRRAKKNHLPPVGQGKQVAEAAE